jgi:hypothetical protein
MTVAAPAPTRAESTPEAAFLIHRTGWGGDWAEQPTVGMREWVLVSKLCVWTDLSMHRRGEVVYLRYKPLPLLSLRPPTLTVALRCYCVKRGERGARFRCC